jgi:hypothetical protein
MLRMPCCAASDGASSVFSFARRTRVALDGRVFDIACGQADVGNAGTETTAGTAKGREGQSASAQPPHLVKLG